MKTLCSFLAVFAFLFGATAFAQISDQIDGIGLYFDLDATEFCLEFPPAPPPAGELEAYLILTLPSNTSGIIGWQCRLDFTVPTGCVVWSYAYPTPAMNMLSPPIFAVSIAAMYEDQPVVGVIFQPSTDSMFTAVKGGDAQLNGRKITAGTEELNEFVSIGLSSIFENAPPDWINKIMMQTRFRNLGATSMQLAYVAKAGFVATIAFNQKLWDIAAGALIVESAGGVLTDHLGNKIFPVDLAGYQGRKFNPLAANKKIHPQIVKLINQ